MFCDDGIGLFHEGSLLYKVLYKVVVVCFQICDVLLCFPALTGRDGTADLYKGIGGPAEGAEHDNLWFGVCGDQLAYLVHSLGLPHGSAAEFHDFHFSTAVFWDCKYTGPAIRFEGNPAEVLPRGRAGR